MLTKKMLGWRFISVLSAFIFIVAGASLSFAAHHENSKTTAGDVKQQVGKTYETFKNYSLSQRDEAVEAAENKLKAIDEKLDSMQNDLDNRWQEMGLATRQKNREILRKLKKEREEVSEWYGGMRHSSVEAWKEVKKGFADSYDRLERAFTQARKDFEK